MIDAPSLTSPVLVHDSVRHGFFTRRGGLSRGIYESLNCGPGSGDDPADVAANRRRVAATLLGTDAPLCTLYQVHGAEVATVDEPWPDEARPRADALVTARPGVLLGILTADCGPVLFADPEAGVIGAAHAGWKGAVAGVLEATVAAMTAIGAAPDRIRAALGPTIAQPSYEVGDDLRAQVCAADPAFERFFAPAARPDHAQFDLPGFIRSRLERLGLAAIDVLGRDTYAEPDMFFSYRRTTHRGETDYGRQISVIALQ